MNLQQLIKLASEGQVRELEVLSLEGGIYIVRAHLLHGCRTLQNARGNTLHLRSTTHVRDLLRDLPASLSALPCVLVQHVVHDEMCGARQGEIAPLRMPFSLAATW
ncbi:DUF6482 family protein [Halopseudomonas sp.]|uniref:DUF6482 family protein n=1 Tax=Halopseudomonas sp. TaxID=2901191 RepID=UPI003001B5A8